MKILIVTGVYPPEIGGPATYTKLVEERLLRKGHNVEVLPFRLVRKYPKIIRHLFFVFKLFLKGRNKDILYAQDPVSVGLPTLIASKILRIPIVVRVAGDYAWEQSVNRFGVSDNIDDFQNKKYSFRVNILKFAQTLTVKYCNKVITPSKYFKNLVGGWIKNKDKVVHIYNGIDLSVIKENRNIFELKTLISAGRLLPWKGYDLLIEILTELTDWKLYIAGDGFELDRLVGLSKKYKVQDRVIFLGNLPREALIEKIQSTEIFVLNTAFESFSFQVVEAMAAGTPVITTDVGNLSEIISNNDQGILITPGDKKQLVDSILKIHTNSEFRNKIINNALSKSKMFSIDYTIENTEKLLYQVVKSYK